MCQFFDLYLSPFAILLPHLLSRAFVAACKCHLSLFQFVQFLGCLDNFEEKLKEFTHHRPGAKLIKLFIDVMGLFHPLDGMTNLKYKLLFFLTPNKKNFKEKGTNF